MIVASTIIPVKSPDTSLLKPVNDSSCVAIQLEMVKNTQSDMTKTLVKLNERLIAVNKLLKQVGDKSPMGENKLFLRSDNDRTWFYARHKPWFGSDGSASAQKNLATSC